MAPTLFLAWKTNVLAPNLKMLSFVGPDTCETIAAPQSVVAVNVLKFSLTPEQLSAMLPPEVVAPAMNELGSLLTVPTEVTST